MNEKLIKAAHVVALTLLALAGVAFMARQTWGTGAQNSNNQAGTQNANASHQNGNTNRGTGGALSSNDRNFVSTAAMDSMAEVELGRLAVERGASDGVKQFGQRMIDDHTRANQELTETAAPLGLTPPAALDAKHRARAEKLARLSGAAFDRAYMKEMVSAHQKAVSLFQRQSARGSQPELKAFAARTLPTLQEHLQMARSMSQHGGGGHGNNSNSNSSRGNSNNMNR